VSARNAAAEVLLVIKTSLTGDDIQPFIDDAAAFVDSRLVPLAVHSDDILKSIERYLACYLITLRDPRLKNLQAGDQQESYQVDPEMSEYLKAAVALDGTGTITECFVNTTARAVRYRVGEGY
jgi:hypothetical protein